MFISSSKPLSWRIFVIYLAVSLFGSAVLVYGLVLIVDPYDSVAFSPDWERHPLQSSGRYYNPSIAKRQEFESFVIGTSTSMMLRPAHLDRLFDERFANLAAKSLSPFEQIKMLDVVRNHHGTIKTLIFGIDTVWCQPSGSDQFVGAGAKVVFPAWLYDDNPWNDLPPLNSTSAQDAWRQFRSLIGWRVRYPVRADGFFDVVDDLYGPYDAEQSRLRLYSQTPILLGRGTRLEDPVFPDLPDLLEALQNLSRETRKILFFAPYHHRYQPASGTHEAQYWTTCKNRVTAFHATLENYHVIDFFFASPLTQTDDNFADGYHYVTSVASEIADVLHAVSRGRAAPTPSYRILNVE